VRWLSILTSCFLVGLFVSLSVSFADKNGNTMDSSDLKKKLTAIQYEVTQCSATEPPFQNEYWDHKDAGIYVDVVSGEPLFSSLDKFDSGTGWPSFSKPINPQNISEQKDNKLAWQERVEVKSKNANSHLGHVFKDGPTSTGLRYCINSASLKFIPVKNLESEGYGEYLPLFNKNKSSVATTEVAVLAGGCFWGMEELLRELPGVLSTRVGYTGGSLDNPSYKEVSTGTSGHAEAIEIVFDSAKISYKEILAWFFRIHDPTTKNRQGNDVGTQYRSAIFYQDDQQKQTAQESIEEAQMSGRWNKPIVTEVLKASAFYPAEEYHQKYLMKNPAGYTCHFVRD